MLYKMGFLVAVIAKLFITLSRRERSLSIEQEILRLAQNDKWAGGNRGKAHK